MTDPTPSSGWQTGGASAVGRRPPAYRDASTRATVLRWLLGAEAIAIGAFGVSAVLDISIVTDEVVPIASAVQLVQAAVAVAYLAWLYRLVGNAAAVTGRGIGFSPPVAVLVHFVPLAGPFLGYWILRDTLEVVDPSGVLPRRLTWTAMVVLAAVVGSIVLGVVVEPFAPWSWRLRTVVLFVAVVGALAAFAGIVRSAELLVGRRATTLATATATA